MRIAIIVFAILGIVVSSLALKVHYDDPGKEPCSINDKWDCGVVNHSPYAVIYGVPVAAIGIAGYTADRRSGISPRQRGVLLLRCWSRSASRFTSRTSRRTCSRSTASTA